MRAHYIDLFTYSLLLFFLFVADFILLLLWSFWEFLLKESNIQFNFNLNKGI